MAGWKDLSEELIAFSADHHDIPLSNLRRLAEAGLVVWLAEQDALWRCPACGKPVDIYSKICRACGSELPNHGMLHSAVKSAEIFADALSRCQHALSPRPPLPISGEGEKRCSINQTSKKRCLLPSPRVGGGAGGGGWLRVNPQITRRSITHS